MTRTVTVIALGVAALGGCGFGGGAGPAPMGNQLASGRDIANLIRAKDTFLYTRTAATADPNRPLDLWRWQGQGSGAPELAVANLDSTADAIQRWLLFGDFLVTGPQATSVYYVPGNVVVPTMYVSVRVFRRDGAALAYQALDSTTVSVIDANGKTDVSMLEARAFDFEGADLIVLGRPSGAAGPYGLYRVGLPSAAITPLPGASFPESWSRIGSSCAPYRGAPCGLFQVIECPDGAGGVTRSSVVYSKPSGATDDTVGTPAWYDLVAGQEMPLPGRGPYVQLTPSPDRTRVAWQDVADDGSVGSTRYWDACTGASGQCAIGAADLVVWSADSARFGGYTRAAGPQQLGLVSVAEQSCDLPAEAVGVVGVLFSPGGDRVSWQQAAAVAPAGAATLWVAGPAGQDARAVVADDRVRSAFFSTDGARLFVQRMLDSRNVLSWIDLASAGAQETPIPGAFGSVAADARRVLITGDWNNEDGSGELHLVDLDAGGPPDVIATSVPQFVTGGRVDGAVPIVYTVRKRFAAPEDGLWAATLPP